MGEDGFLGDGRNYLLAASLVVVRFERSIYKRNSAKGHLEAIELILAAEELFQREFLYRNTVGKEFEGRNSEHHRTDGIA